MTAEEARKASKRLESKKWNFFDAWQLAEIERKIDISAKKGNNSQYFPYKNIRPKVARRLRENGFGLTVSNEGWGFRVHW